jgi:hypothetical protein
VAAAGNEENSNHDGFNKQKEKRYYVFVSSLASGHAFFYGLSKG